MNAAKADRSERLKRVDSLLSHSGELSTLEIANGANVCAVNSIIAELRANGRVIHCERRGSTWFYRKVV